MTMMPKATATTPRRRVFNMTTEEKFVEMNMSAYWHHKDCRKAELQIPFVRYDTTVRYAAGQDKTSQNDRPILRGRFRDRERCV